MPWVALLAFLLLGSQCQPFVVIRFASWAPLCVPLAASLGYRYKGRGLVVVALAGVFLVPGVELTPDLGLPALPDIFLLSLFACVIAQNAQSIDQLLRPAPPKDTRLAWFLLLPLSIGLWGIELGEVSLALSLSLMWIAFAFMFYLGAAGAGIGRAAALVSGTALIGVVANQFGFPLNAELALDADRVDLPLLGLVELSSLWMTYWFRTLTDVVVALTFFAAGRVCGPFLRHAKPRRRWVAISLVSFVALASSGTLPIGQWIAVAERPRLSPSLAITTALWPLLGLISTLLFAHRGALLAVSAVSLLCVGEAAIAGYFPFMMRLDVDAPLVILGFAALGLALRGQVLGTPLKQWSSGWAVYVGLALMVYVQLEPRGHAWLPLFLIAAVFTGLGAIRLRNWIQGRIVAPHPGWIALLSILVLLWTVWSSIWASVWAMASAIKQLGAAATVRAVIDDLDQWMILAVGGCVILWLSLSAMEVLASSAHKCLADVRRLVEVITHLLKHRALPPPGTDTPDETLRPLPWWPPTWLLSHLKRGTVLIAVLLVIATSGRAGWLELQEYREDRGEDREYALRHAPNEALVQAALDTLGPWGVKRMERDGRWMEIETQWAETADLPDIRRRVLVSVGSRDSLIVDVDRQSRRFGLWVEASGDSLVESEDADEIKQRVLERAGLGQAK